MVRLPEDLNIPLEGKKEHSHRNNDIRNEEVHRKHGNHTQDIAAHEGKFLRRKTGGGGDGYKKNVTDLYKSRNQPTLGTINEN